MSSEACVYSRKCTETKRKRKKKSMQNSSTSRQQSNKIKLEGPISKDQQVN